MTGGDELKMRTKSLNVIIMVLCLAPAAASAQLAQSTFNTGTDGWVSVTLPYPSAIPPTIVASFAPTWQATGGGRLYMADPDGTGAGNTEYWQAPAAFLGAKGAAFGQTLEFDLADQGTGYPPFAQEDIILIGGGLTMATTLSVMPTGILSHYVVNLTEAGWKRDSRRQSLLPPIRLASTRNSSKRRRSRGWRNAR